MFGIYTQFGLFSNYSFNKNCTIPYFINLITDNANFTVSASTSLFNKLDTYHPWMKRNQLSFK